MKKIAFLLLLLHICEARAEIVLIGNLDNGLNSMTKKEVREVYMGRNRLLPNGTFALPIDLNNLRTEFYQYLTGRSMAQINAYWARLLFSGQTSPPMRSPDSQAVIKIVTENKGAIGYINKNNIAEDNVRILLILK